VANNVKRLSVDGTRLHDAPDLAPTAGVRIYDELNGFNQRLDAVLPAVRPRERSGGLAAARAAEREQARARVENNLALEKMRSHGQTVRAISQAYRSRVDGARRDPYLSEEGKAAKLRELEQAMHQQLEANAISYWQAENQLLTTFSGRNRLWANLRDKAGPVQATVAAAAALAGVIDKWPPEIAIARLEQAISERDVTTMHFVTPIMMNLAANDTRYLSLQAQAESVLEDAKFAMGDEDSDAGEIAAELAAEMREQLSTAQKTLVKNDGKWDPLFDNAKLLGAFDPPTHAGGTDGSAAA
jgi:hypothetical protein